MIVWRTTKSETLVQYVSDAFANFGNSLLLSQSPLAVPEIIQSALILDSDSLAEDEKGLALQVVLRWSVLQLAPIPTSAANSAERSFDDPTWMSPLWWRFNILHHLYIDPLHPDQFLQDQKRVNSLISLMGIPSMDIFYDERKRGIREVADRLIWLANSDNVKPIGRLMVETLIAPLWKESQTLLGDAAMFREAFQLSWLKEITALPKSKVADEWNKLRKRGLIRSETNRRFYVPKKVRLYLVEHYSGENLRGQHDQIGRFYCEEGAALAAAWHYQEGNRFREASTIILEHKDQWAQTTDSDVDALKETLMRFDRATLPDYEWGEIQALLGRVLHKTGNTQDAITAIRQALQVSDDLTQKTNLYRQLGKLHEDKMPELALTYYSQADQICPDDSLRTELLKDRAWLYILQEEWNSAETDLTAALALATTQTQQADINDAFAELYRLQNNLDKALSHAHTALISREESGDLLAVAKSYNNLGTLYNNSQQPSKGLAAHTESLRIINQIGNDELSAKALINIGTDYFKMDRFEEALKNYLSAHDKFTNLGMSRQIGISYYNLTEVLIELERYTEADHYLSAGFAHCNTHNLQVVKNYLEQLQTKIPQRSEISLSLKPAHQLALELTRENQRLTRKSLIEASKQDQRFDRPLTTDTAKRRLADLVDNGILQKQGKGAGTYYTQPT